MVWRRLFAVVLFVIPAFAVSEMAEPYMPAARATDDSTTQAIADIRAAEKRHIPLEVQLKAADRYAAGGPVVVSIMVTNLFDSPLLMNSRLLVNHPRLEGEVSFRIIGPDGERIEIQRLITPLTLRDEDFVMLYRGQSIQRDIDLLDLYGLKHKGVYKIQVSYHNEIDHDSGALRAWKGMAVSDTVEIRLD